MENSALCCNLSSFNSGTSRNGKDIRGTIYVVDRVMSVTRGSNSHTSADSHRPTAQRFIRHRNHECRMFQEKIDRLPGKVKRNCNRRAHMATTFFCVETPATIPLLDSLRNILMITISHHLSASKSDPWMELR